ncbi:hypothetical protein KC354_g29 [Hortaea werneckii]|nr:hypothetical protein KC354_g29 [Hortaea werneckii]
MSLSASLTSTLLLQQKPSTMRIYICVYVSRNSFARICRSSRRRWLQCIFGSLGIPYVRSQPLALATAIQNTHRTDEYI